MQSLDHQQAEARERCGDRQELLVTTVAEQPKCQADPGNSGDKDETDRDIGP